MGTDDDGVIEAARAVRPYLERLADDLDAAARLDQAIADELNGTTSEKAATAGRLRDLLAAQEDTAWFLDTVLADAPAYRPPYHQPRYVHRGSGGMASPAGDPGPVDADRYACPHGDYVDWYRPDVGTPVPDCPTHGVQLTRT